MKRMVWLLSIVFSVLMMTGCGKKEEPVPTPSPSQEPQQNQTMTNQDRQTAQDITQAAQETVSSAVVQARAFTTQIDLEQSVAALKSETETMEVSSLVEVARKYRDAIIEKQDDIKALAAKLEEIPMAQKLGDQARQIASDIDMYTQTLGALKERFDVYLSAIQQKGGDVSGLTF